MNRSVDPERLIAEETMAELAARLTPSDRAEVETWNPCVFIRAMSEHGKCFPNGRAEMATNLAVRDRLICEMADRFFPAAPASRQADEIARAICRYHGSADWKRDRIAANVTYRDALRGHCWAILKAVPLAISGRSIRRVLATNRASHGQKSVSG